jgi:putative peptide zinc metalloprotease protein
MENQLQNTRRVIPVKIRQDLKIENQIIDGKSIYVVKDPMSLNYFRLRGTEYFIFSRLDGNHTVEDLKNEVNAEHPGLNITDEEIVAFINQLRNINFLENFGPNAGAALFQRKKVKQKAKLKQTLMSFLFIKLPIVDPNRFFKTVYPHIRFLFRRSFLYLFWALMVLAVFLVIQNRGEFVHQISGFFSLNNFILIWLAIVLIKMTHELGHGFICTHYGGEVHELGVLLIVFTPWLYCNVSDAWIFKTRRERLYVSAAGIITELMFAAVAAIVWSVTQPGVLNSLCYTIVILCSVDNLIRNGNPLLRYDGYYVLIDYLDIPSLRTRSRKYLLDLMKKKILRMDIEMPDLSPRLKRIFLVYGSLSSAYTLFIITAIIGLVGRKFFIIGVIMACFLAYGMFIRPVIRTLVFMISHRDHMQFGREAVITIASVFLVIFAALFLVRPNLNIYSTSTVETAPHQYLRTSTSGFLEKWYANTGQTVEKGMVVARLKNPEMTTRLQQLKLDHDIVQRGLEKALGSGQTDVVAQHEIEVNRIKKDIHQLETDISHLDVVAGETGTVLTPHLEERIGDYLEEGDILCEIGNEKTMTVQVIVPESEIINVRLSQDMVLKAYAWPEKEFKGKVTEIAAARMDALKNTALSSKFGGNLPTEIGRDQQSEILALPHYQITMRLENADGYLKSGMTGVCRINAERRSIAAILFHKVIRLINPNILL